MFGSSTFFDLYSLRLSTEVQDDDKGWMVASSVVLTLNQKGINVVVVVVVVVTSVVVVIKSLVVVVVVVVTVVDLKVLIGNGVVVVIIVTLVNGYKNLWRSLMS